MASGSASPDNSVSTTTLSENENKLYTMLKEQAQVMVQTYEGEDVDKLGDILKEMEPAAHTSESGNTKQATEDECCTVEAKNETNMSSQNNTSQDNSFIINIDPCKTPGDTFVSHRIIFKEIPTTFQAFEDKIASITGSKAPYFTCDEYAIFQMNTMDDLIATVENKKQIQLFLRVEGKSIAEQVQHLDEHFTFSQEPVEAADNISHGSMTCQDLECFGEVDRLKQRIEELEEQNKNWSDNQQELIQHKTTLQHKNIELDILNEENQYFKQKLVDLRSELIDLKLDNTRLQEEVNDLMNKDLEDCGW